METGPTFLRFFSEPFPNNIDTLVREERKSSIRLGLVVTSEERGDRKRSPSAINNKSDFRPGLTVAARGM